MLVSHFNSTGMAPESSKIFIKLVWVIVKSQLSQMEVHFGLILMVKCHLRLKAGRIIHVCVSKLDQI